MRRTTWVELTLSTTVLSPVLVVLGVLMAYPNLEFATAYWLDLSSKATGSILLLAPSLAALSAWDAARWRTLATAAARTWTELLARQLLVVAAVTATTFGVTLALMYAQAPPAAGRPRVDVLLTGLWMVVAYSALGFAIGRAAPRLVGPVVSFAVVWFWVAYTPAVQPFWLRNVTGNLAASCCGSDAQLVDRALAAPAVVGAGLVVAAALVVRRPTGRAALAGAAAAVASSVLVAASWMADVGADPVRPRVAAQACSTVDGTTLCVWPEHRDRLAAASAPLGRAARNLRAAGLQVPERLQESLPPDSRRWTFSLNGSTDEQWVASLATSPLEYVPPCLSNGGLWSAGEFLDLVAAWSEVTAGIDESAAVDRHGVDPAQLRDVLSRPRDEQARWYELRVSRMDTCDGQP